MLARSRPGAVVLMGLLVLLLTCTRTADAQGLIADGQGPFFEPSPCPVEVPAWVTVECGYLVVPEDRQDPEGRTIRLAVAILHSYSDDPAPDPIVYLKGGPGGSALEGIHRWLDSLFLDDRDLILFEQRGTRYSEPWLDCPELDHAYVENWALGLSDEVEAAREVEAAIACRNRLLAEGADLAAYHSAASAADLEDLRHVLGYDQWNLYGISYGTRLALTAMRDQPAGIRSVILDSVYPPPAGGLIDLAPNTARVFDKLFDDCAADPACHAAYPNLEADLYQLVEQANAQPIPVTVRHPDTGEQLHLPLDGEDIVAELFIAFYDSSVIPFLPLVIDQVRQGNHDVLVPLTDFALSAILSGSEGMHISVECAEEVPFNPPEAIAAAAEAVPSPLRAFSVTSTLEICGIWGVDAPDPVENEPVYSDIPTLVLEGEYDPITPPASGRLAAETLDNSFYAEFPGLGHGVTDADCPLSVAMAFLNDPTVEPDTACIHEMHGPGFLTTTDFYLTPAAYRLLAELNAGEHRLLFILLGFLDLFFLLGVFILLRALLRLLRLWPGATPPGDWLFHSLLGAVAALNLLFLLGLAGFIIGTLFSAWSLVLFGLPAAAKLLLLIPLLTALLTFGLIVFVVVAWKKQYWSAVRRVLYSSVTLVLLAFPWFLSQWDLMGFGPG